jgi:hypothetical protein
LGILGLGKNVAKTVQGFGVRSQGRKKIRSTLQGTFEGYEWFVQFEHSTLFSWTIGKMRGYAGPTVGDVLRVMRKAARAQAQLEEVYQDQGIPDEAYNALRLLYRWERRATQGRLTITGPHGKGDKAHYRIKEISP